MDLSIVIINWNSLEFTRQCVASIVENVSGLEYEIIVVDNASPDGSGRLIESLSLPMKAVHAPRNLGFSRGNNLGVDHSSGKIILFLNPDTLVQGTAIQEMTAALRDAKDLGVIGCTLLNRDLSIQTTCIQRFPTISNQLFGIDLLKRSLPKLSMFGMRELFASANKGVTEVEVVSGACLMVKRSVFESVGRFSTDYFMYAEEADLCYKVRKGGWKVGYIRDAQIVHFGGQSTGKREDGFADIAMRESLFKFFKKFRGAPYALLYRAALLLGAVARIALALPLLAFPVRHKDALRVLRKWTRISAWSLALQSSHAGSES